MKKSIHHEFLQTPSESINQGEINNLRIANITSNEIDADFTTYASAIQSYKRKKIALIGLKTASSLVPLRGIIFPQTDITNPDCTSFDITPQESEALTSFGYNKNLSGRHSKYSSNVRSTRGGLATIKQQGKTSNIRGVKNFNNKWQNEFGHTSKRKIFSRNHIRFGDIDSSPNNTTSGFSKSNASFASNHIRFGDIESSPNNTISGFSRSNASLATKAVLGCAVLAAIMPPTTAAPHTKMTSNSLAPKKTNQIYNGYSNWTLGQYNNSSSIVRNASLPPRVFNNTFSKSTKKSNNATGSQVRNSTLSSRGFNNSLSNNTKKNNNATSSQIRNSSLPSRGFNNSLSNNTKKNNNATGSQVRHSSLPSRGFNNSLSNNTKKNNNSTGSHPIIRQSTISNAEKEYGGSGSTLNNNGTLTTSHKVKKRATESQWIDTDEKDFIDMLDKCVPAKYGKKNGNFALFLKLTGEFLLDPIEALAAAGSYFPSKKSECSVPTNQETTSKVIQLVNMVGEQSSSMLPGGGLMNASRKIVGSLLILLADSLADEKLTAEQLDVILQNASDMSKTLMEHQLSIKDLNAFDNKAELEKNLNYYPKFKLNKDGKTTVDVRLDDTGSIVEKELIIIDGLTYVKDNSKIKKIIPVHYDFLHKEWKPSEYVGVKLFTQKQEALIKEMAIGIDRYNIEHKHTKGKECLVPVGNNIYKVFLKTYEVSAGTPSREYVVEMGGRLVPYGRQNHYKPYYKNGMTIYHSDNNLMPDNTYELSHVEHYVFPDGSSGLTDKYPIKRVGQRWVFDNDREVDFTKKLDEKKLSEMIAARHIFPNPYLADEDLFPIDDNGIYHGTDGGVYFKFHGHYYDAQVDSKNREITLIANKLNNNIPLKDVLSGKIHVSGATQYYDYMGNLWYNSEVKLYNDKAIDFIKNEGISQNQPSLNMVRDNIFEIDGETYVSMLDRLVPYYYNIETKKNFIHAKGSSEKHEIKKIVEPKHGKVYWVLENNSQMIIDKKIARGIRRLFIRPESIDTNNLMPHNELGVYYNFGNGHNYLKIDGLFYRVHYNIQHNLLWLGNQRGKLHIAYESEGSQSYHHTICTRGLGDTLRCSSKGPYLKLIKNAKKIKSGTLEQRKEEHDKLIAQNTVNSLTQEDKELIKKYTQHQSVGNQFLKQRVSLEDNVNSFAKKLKDAVSKASKFEGVTYRFSVAKKGSYGNGFLSGKIKVDDELLVDVFMSSSTSGGYVKHFKKMAGDSDGDQVFFVLKSKTGRNIAPYSIFQDEKGEAEVLFMPGTKFKVREISKGVFGGLTYVVAEEIVGSEITGVPTKNIHTGEYNTVGDLITELNNRRQKRSFSSNLSNEFS